MKIISFFRTNLLIILIAISMDHVYGADSKSYQTFLNEYKDLFLTDTDRLHLEGRHEEAKQEKMRNWRTKDYACNIPTEESLVKKDRQDKLIQMICQNIENVKKSYDEEKDALLKCQEEIDSIINDQIAFEKHCEDAWRARDTILHEEYSKSMFVRDYIEKRYDDITKVPLDGEQKDGEQNVYMLLDEHLWTFEKINQENKQKYLDIAEKLYDIWHEKVMSLEQEIKRNREEFENELNTSKNLHMYRREYLLQEKQRLEAVKYPHEKIIRLEAQLEFVKENAFFLSPQPRPKEVIHGLSRVSDPLGNGVTIGILDYFPRNLSSLTNELRPKVINPEFNGSENPDKENALHGICVASIAASRKIGVAQGAHLEYLDNQMLAFKNKQTSFLFGDAICQNQTRLEVHVSFLESLPKFEKGKAYPIEKASIDLLNITFENNIQEILQFEGIGESPLLQTQAKVINISLGNSTFGANFDLNTPDANLADFIHHKAFADLGILSVTTLGNNGLYLAGSNGLFVKRALAKAKVTRNKILFVGGLLEDGLTISSLSNQPGDDPDLQERTVFAQDANVPCLFINTNTYGKESGTSFACPSVSGAAAIIMSQCPSLTTEEVSLCILKGATPILLDKENLPYELKDCDAGTILESHPELKAEIKQSRTKYGMGRLNVGRALERAKKMVR